MAEAVRPGFSTTVGILGAGTMGGAICTKLCAAGYRVLVFDTQASAVDAAVSHGATSMASAAKLAAASDIVLVVVSTDAQVLGVMDDSFTSALRAGSVVVLHSTVHPDTCHKCGDALRRSRARLIDAAMSGGRTAIEAGTLLLMVGGDDGALSAAIALLEVYAGRIIHLGPLGSGMAAKLCSIVVLHANRLALYEGIRLAAALGLDPRRFVEAVDCGAARSWVSAHWLEADFMVLAKGLGDHQLVAQMEKDLAHAASLASGTGGSSELLEMLRTKLPTLARSGLRLT